METNSVPERNTALVCSHCQAALPVGARFCMNCGQPVSAGENHAGEDHAGDHDGIRHHASHPSDESRHTRLAAAAPAPLVEKMRAAARLAGERRTVTALYLDIVGSTGLAAQLGPEIWTAVINGALDCASPIVYKYEGTVAHVQDDELLAFFGAPVAHEDDPVRAVRVGLEILEAVHRYARVIKHKYNADFAVRISLSTGPVTIGPVGTDLKYEYSALGGTLNLVAQVEAADMPMCVLVTDNTYSFIAPFFDCTDMGVFARCPECPPVRIYRVDKPKASPGRPRGLAGLESPMVGRDTELAALLPLPGLVQAGLGRAAIILGEPGIGKTRLISEWKKNVQAGPDFLWIEGRCLSYGQRQAYHLISSLLHSLIGLREIADEPETRSALADRVEAYFSCSETPADKAGFYDVYPYLANLLALKLDDRSQAILHPLDPQAILSRTQAALKNLFQALADRQPIALVLEDLHWADPSSTELLFQLLPLVTSERILLCMVMRTEHASAGWQLVTHAREMLAGRLTEISLEPLSEPDSRLLVSNILEIEALPDRTRDAILRKAEGNPFFVEEVIRMLIERGALVQQQGRWRAAAEIDSVQIPDNLMGLLQARMDRLPEEVKRTLRVAAVIGRQFPVRVLEQVMEKEKKEEKQ